MAKEKNVDTQDNDIIPASMASERKIKLEEYLGATERRMNIYATSILRKIHTNELHTMKEWDAVADSDMGKVTNPVRPQVTKE